MERYLGHLLVYTALTLLMTACGVRHETHAAASSPVALQRHASPLTTAQKVAENDLYGEWTAEMMSRWYHDTRTSCPGDRPAWVCTGIVGRSVAVSNSFDSLNPSPSSQNRGGVSASFLRADMSYKRVFYPQGYMFIPNAMIAPGIMPLDILCAYALDAWGDPSRNARGCGAYAGKANTGPCRSIGVTTTQQWLDNFRRNGSQGGGQCGFDVTDAPGGHQAGDFYSLIQAHEQLGAVSFADHTEVIISTWPQNVQKKLPVAAFYYVQGNTGARDAARQMQRSYANRTGSAAPIMAYRLPTVVGAPAAFSYAASDQAVLPSPISTRAPNLLNGTYNSATLTLAELVGNTCIPLGIPTYESQAIDDELTAAAGTENPGTGPPRRVDGIWMQSACLPTNVIVAQINRHPAATVPVFFYVDRQGMRLTSAQRLVSLSPMPAFATPLPVLRKDEDRLLLGGWAGQTTGYRLELVWRGSTEHADTSLVTAGSSPLSYPINPTWFSENLGKTVQVHYIVRNTTGALVGISDTLSIPVDAVDRLDAPVITLRSGGGGIDIAIRLPSSERGDVVQATLKIDDAPDETLTARVTADKAGVEFQRDRAWLQRRLGKNLVVTYTATRADEAPRLSYASSLKLVE